MIRATSFNPPKRRIAVIEIPRPQRARLGSIRNGDPSPIVAWTTLTDEAPESSANWMSLILTQQAQTRQTTPGTLVYTPASDTPQQNVAPWNSWLQPNCPPGTAADATATDPAAPRAVSKLLLLFTGITAAAAAAYLMAEAERKHR